MVWPRDFIFGVQLQYTKLLRLTWMKVNGQGHISDFTLIGFSDTPLELLALGNLAYIMEPLELRNILRSAEYEPLEHIRHIRLSMWSIKWRLLFEYSDIMLMKLKISSWQPWLRRASMLMHTSSYSLPTWEGTNNKAVHGTTTQRPVSTRTGTLDVNQSI